MDDLKVSQLLNVVVVEDLDTNPAHVYLAGLAAGSRRTMRKALDIIADLASGGNANHLGLDWAGLRFQHTAAIRAHLAEGHAPATANKMLSALRGVLKTAWRLGRMSAEDYQRATDLERIIGETLPAGRAITPGELAALMAACGQDPAGIRDAAIIGCLYSGGLRRAEVIALDLADFDPVTNDLKVRGKRQKERLVPLMTGADLALQDWLAIRGDWPGPLFVGIRRGSHLQKERMTTQAIYHVVSERAVGAGVGDISPHDFRRSLIGDLLDAGADIATVANLVGHADVQTTRRYDRRGDKAKRKAVSLLHLPYHRRTLKQRG